MPISKRTFLKTNVVSTKTTDKFYVDKCSFCWDTFNHSPIAARVLLKDRSPHPPHTPVRFLTCNHIIRYSCLFTAVEVSGGNPAAPFAALRSSSQTYL
jgi:hypothetical protein